jgi:hypothetical protein
MGLWAIGAVFLPRFKAKMPASVKKLGILRPGLLTSFK